MLSPFHPDKRSEHDFPPHRPFDIPSSNIIRFHESKDLADTIILQLS